jgi:hypothetical protein
MGISSLEEAMRRLKLIKIKMGLISKEELQSNRFSMIKVPDS